MAELKVEIPNDLEVIAKGLDKKELNEIVSKALRDKSTEALLFKYADDILKKSKLSDGIAIKLGSELKERVAKRHGLM